MAEEKQTLLNVRINLTDTIKEMADYQQKIDAISIQMQKLTALFKNGDISVQQYNQEMETLTELKRENAKLEHAYRTALDMDTIRERAEELGMIPAEEAQKMTVRVSVPEHEEEPTAWENFLWFLSGLLGPAEESES